MQGENGDPPPGAGPSRPEVDGYEVREELGRGGFATVYRAVQLSVGREVALKIISLRSLDDATERRFHREVRAVGALSGHPTVVAIHDAGTTRAGEPFISMQLVEGGSWGDHVRQHGPLAPLQVASIGIDVVEALEAAHAAGITHRDVKPDNLLIGRRGRTLVTDFGIATLGDGTETATGSLTGTLAFTAPELLRGARPGPASDVFALGATLHALLTGRSPFSGGEEDHAAAVIWRVANEEAQPLPPTVPVPLRRAIEACLAKDPDGRPALAALGNQLRALAGSGPAGDATATQVAPSPPPGAPGSGGDVGRPSRRGWWVAAGVALLTVVVAAVAVVAARDGGGADALVDGAGRDGASTSASSTTATTEATAGSGSADMPRITSSVVVRDDPSNVAATSDAVWVTHPTDGTVSRIDPDTGRVEASIEVELFADGIAVSEDAVWVTHRAVEGSVSRIDPATDEVVATVPVGGRPLGVAVGASGVWVSNEGDETVTRIDPETDEVVATIPVGDSTFGLAATPSAVWVATLLSDLRRIDPGTDDVAASVDVEAPGVGRDLVIVGSEVWLFGAAPSDAPATAGTLTRIDAATDEVIETTTVGTDPTGVAAGDGDVWVVSDTEGDLTRLGATTGEVTGTLEIGAGLGGVAVVDGVLWVTVADEDRVVRLEG